jgi:beta-lactamase class A
MSVSRRSFLAATGMTAGAASFGWPELADAAGPNWLRHRILDVFRKLPGELSLKIVAPPHAGKRGLVVEHQPCKRLFIGSAFKAFVLCEALRQADSSSVVETITSRSLSLNESVWSPDAPTFNPPHLAGYVSERTAMEAMILHSDNTGADMLLKLVEPNNVRRFVKSVGLNSVRIPDSTRIFVGYLLGAKDYRHFTWRDYVAAERRNAPFVNPPLNNVETLAATADDLVTFYRNSLHGAYFKNPATLQVFRETLAMGDAIWLMPFPLGVTAFAKGGSINVPGFHALCVPGAMSFDNRWVYFCITLNWFARPISDPSTTAAFAEAGSAALTLVKEALSCK